MKANSLAALALLAAATSPAFAEIRTIAGDSLVLTTGADSRVTVQPDPTLAHTVRIDADNGCVTVTGITPAGQPGLVTVSNEGCDGEAGPVSIAVPPGFPIIATTHGGGDLKIGDTDGPLTVTLAGGGALTAGRLAALTLAIRGDGDATVTQVSGPATVDITGSGDLRLQRLEGPLRTMQRGSGNLVVGALNAPSGDVLIQGSGDALLGRGTIGRLHAVVGGSGDLGVAATVGDADVQASGGSDIKLSKVTGQLTKNTSGGSDVYVGTGLVSFGLGKLADAVSDPNSRVDIDLGDKGPQKDSGSGFGHVVAGFIVLALVVLLWRTVQRRGGIATLRTRSASATGGPTHPAVLALRDTMSRLEVRLAKLEGYVTSREFDLHRKFRELDPQ